MAAELFSVGWQFDFSFAFQYLLPRFGARSWACIQKLRDQHRSPCCSRSGPRVFVGQIYKQGYTLGSVGLEEFRRSFELVNFLESPQCIRCGTYDSSGQVPKAFPSARFITV